MFGGYLRHSHSGGCQIYYDKVFSSAVCAPRLSGRALCPGTNLFRSSHRKHHRPTGAAVSGATVQVRNIGTQQVRTSTTDSSGEYVIPDLPAAHYTLTIS